MSLVFDARDGRIYREEDTSGFYPQDRIFLREVAFFPTPLQRDRGRVARSEFCLCGSGRRFKNCCSVVKPRNSRLDPPTESLPSIPASVKITPSGNPFLGEKPSLPSPKK